MTSSTSKRKLVAAPNMDRFISSFFNASLGEVLNTTRQPKSFTKPSTNVIREEDQYILELALPGFSKEDIDIKIENEVLTVSDSKATNEHEDSNAYQLREFNYKGFSKSFYLSEDIDEEKVNAVFTEGVLRIILGKKEEALPKAPKKISIQ